MPSLSQIQLPLPKQWQEFEDIVASALRNRGTQAAPRRFGRSGQRQNGVDIYYEDNLARRTGVQCKLETTFTVKDLNNAVAEAENFRPTLETFIIALGLPRDVKLQTAAYELSAQRASTQRFRVTFMFWDDIQDDLVRDSVELSKHYPQFFPPQAPQPVAQSASPADKVATQRYEALCELSALRLGCLPDRNHPDMDWSEACEVIAVNLWKHAKVINAIRKKHVAVLPRDVDTSLERAEAAAEEGNFDLAAFSVNGDVPEPACKAASSMYDLLKQGEENLRSFLENHHGFKF